MGIHEVAPLELAEFADKNRKVEEGNSSAAVSNTVKCVFNGNDIVRLERWISEINGSKLAGVGLYSLTMLHLCQYCTTIDYQRILQAVCSAGIAIEVMLTCVGDLVS